MPDMNCYNTNCPNRIKGFIKCCAYEDNVASKDEKWTVSNCPKYTKDRRGEGFCVKCGNQITKLHDYYFNGDGRLQHSNC